MFDAPIYICVQNMAFRIVIDMILYLLFRKFAGDTDYPKLCLRGRNP